MRIDVVTIFPDYFTPLSLSLPGKAITDGLVDMQVHNLRSFTEDNHHSVDDTPYGGGPGMVMRADIWGKALDSVLTIDAQIIIPTPSGIPFKQEHADQLATSGHLIFACGRYEGIDQRVFDYYRSQIHEYSLGDYIFFGGEVASLVIIESVVRLIPGVIGNELSYQQDSFRDGLLEGPRYTRPHTWRGLSVPEILLSGNHAQINEWNNEQAYRRTLERRSDLITEHPDITEHSDHNS